MTCDAVSGRWPFAWPALRLLRDILKLAQGHQIFVTFVVGVMVLRSDVSTVCSIIESAPSQSTRQASERQGHTALIPRHVFIAHVSDRMLI